MVAKPITLKKQKINKKSQTLQNFYLETYESIMLLNEFGLKTKCHNVIIFQEYKTTSYENIHLEKLAQ